MKYFDPEAYFILQWNRTFLICSALALSLDPLFLYIPIVDDNQNCLDVDSKLQFTFAVWVIIPKFDGPASFLTKNFLKFIILSQFVPRVIQVSLLYQKVTEISGFLIETAWAGATCNFLLYVPASHDVGALWYLFAIESELRCWNIACQRNNCYSNYFSVGQGLKTSTFYGEILFADFISVMGLVLFGLLIGNIQKYLQSFSNFTLRVQEMKEKRREAEELMSHIHLHEELREKVRKHKRYQWEINRGFQLDSFLRDLPRHLKRDIMRHLCLDLLKRVPLLQQMDERFLETMCDGLKPVLYTDNSYIFREGDPVREMLFLTSGEVLSMTTDGGRIGFFNSILLKAGDFCGDELLTWAFGSATPGLPFSSSTAKAFPNVQAFALAADDLMLVASEFRHLHGRLPQHTLRFYSKQWRTWAACYIQHAWRWRSSRKRKQETSTISISSSVYPSRFSTDILRRNHVYNAQVSTPRLQTMLPLKPTLDF